VRLNGMTALSQQQTTLAERLSGAGYRTGAFVGAFVLDGRWGLNQGFQHYDDRFDLRKVKHIDLAGVQRPANEVVDAAMRWLDENREAPFFAWLHLYDPHTPYAPPEPLFSEFGRRGPEGLYEGEIAFMDQELGRFLRWMHDIGFDDRTIFVVVGDHGEALGSHVKGRTATSSTTGPCACRSSSKRHPTICAACAWTRRSASWTCSRPCCRSPGSTPQPARTDDRWCR
jgi:arylsulfatase A-like enzyme